MSVERTVTAADQDGLGRRSWRALGTSVHVLVTDERRLDAAAAAVAKLLDEVDATYSRFRSDSELRRLDLRPGRGVRVSPLLAQVVEASLRVASLTDGAVDPTVGRALRLIGYGADFSAIAGRTGPLELRLEAVPGWRTIRFDPVARILDASGIELDFGSTGKALAADLAAQAALRATATDAVPVGVLVSLGGDIATSGTSPAGGWRVLVAEDSETPSDAEGEVIAISGGAVATSSTAVRHWERGGVRLHHLVDPATGLPVVGPWRTVSVLAVSCVDANAAATATIVKGAAGLDWVSGQGLPTRLVGHAGEIVRLGGWPTP
jgi:thiamine biosynthesis lipoprotein